MLGVKVAPADRLDGGAGAADSSALEPGGAALFLGTIIAGEASAAAPAAGKGFAFGGGGRVVLSGMTSSSSALLPCPFALGVSPSSVPLRAPLPLLSGGGMVGCLGLTAREGVTGVAKNAGFEETCAHIVNESFCTVVFRAFVGVLKDLLILYLDP